MRHILHLITNTVEPTLQAILRSQSERTDIQVTIVTTQNPKETVVSANTPVFSLSNAEGSAIDSSTSMHSPRFIEYDRLMNLIFEAEAVVTW